MSGKPQLVYGDGWEDLKDCCGGAGLFGEIKRHDQGFR